MKKRTILITALALILMVSGGTFAFTYTSANNNFGLQGDSDVAQVEAGADAGSMTGEVWGDYKGDLPENKELFTIAPEADFTGDLHAVVTLTNPDEMAKAYKYFNMMIEISSVDAETGHTYQVLSLENGKAEFDIPGGTADSYSVMLIGGGYATFGTQGLVAWDDDSAVDPQLFCEVVPRGA